MTPAPVFVYGSGGHGKLVAGALLERGERPAGFVDDDPGNAGRQVLGLPVYSREWFVDLAARQPVAIALGVGNNWARQAIAERSAAAGMEIVTVIHPSAILAASATVGRGTAVLAGVVINPEARIGAGVILNSGAVIEHDVVLGDYCHISTNVALGGAARVGTLSLVGVGASLRPGVSVGCGSIVGVGSAVVNDIPDGVVAVGVPARVVRPHTPSAVRSHEQVVPR